MSNERRLFDDLARVASGAAGAFGDFRSRLEGEIHDQIERLLARMNLVTREDHEVVAAVAQKARAEQEVLAERVAALEAKLMGVDKGKATPAKATKPKPAATKPVAAKAAKPKAAKPKSSTAKPARKPRSGGQS
jgi:BMFP domain-containing protein YqiC